MRASFSSELYEILIKTSLGCRILTDGKSDKMMYFAIGRSDPRKISYIPANRLEHFGDDLFDNTLRMKYSIAGRPGKVLARLLDKVDAKELTEFSSQYYAELERAGITSESEFKLTSDFEHYRESHHFNDSGTLGTSCMRYDECIDDNWFEIYERTGTEILMLMKKGKISARALIWHNVRIQGHSGTHTFMDRIYTNNSADDELFFMYARDHGWVYKQRQSYSHKTDIWIKVDGEYRQEDCTMTVPTRFEPDYFPYVDTFSYFGYDEISNSEDSDHEGVMEETDGSLIRSNSVYSEYEDCDIRENQSVYSDHLRTYLYEESSTYVGHINSYMPEDHTDLVIAICGTRTVYDRVVEFNNDHYLKDQCVWSAWEGEDIPFEIAVEVNGEYILEKNLDQYLEETENNN